MASRFFTLSAFETLNECDSVRQLATMERANTDGGRPKSLAKLNQKFTITKQDKIATPKTTSKTLTIL
jgi:hypothetical protein